MFSKLSAAGKLSGALGLLTLLLAAVLGVGLVNMTRMETGEEKLVSDTIAGTALLTAAQKALVNYDRLLYIHVSEKNAVLKPGIERGVSDEKSNIGSLVAQFLKITKNQGDQASVLLKRMQEMFALDVPVMESSMAGKEPEALDLLNKNVAPLFQLSIRDFDSMLQSQNFEATSSEREAKEQYFLSLWILGGLGLGSLVLAAFLSRSLVRMIRRPLAEANSLAAAIIRGDLTTKVDDKLLQAQDEFGNLLKSLIRMQEDLADSVRQIDSSALALEQVGSQLAENLEETVDAVGAIGQTLEAVNGKVVNQSASVTETSATITEIVKNIEGLREDIDDQSSSVT